MSNKVSLLIAVLLFIPTLCIAQNVSTPAKKNKVLHMNPEYSISKNTGSSKKHSTLMAVIKAADLEEILNYDGPFTVFAPSNNAFSSTTDIDFLLDPTHKKEVYSLLTHHIVAGNLTASKILKAMCRGNGIASFTTVLGNKLIATMNGIDIVLTDEFGNTAKITNADANQCNGVIHEIDSVFLPNKI
ncbi:fasciclin domain-containing protein [uncultured Maribacter sp.]|uniref:fasciclin domain-containing protein n=1 Tax=uncultured Maribacter sp. TaxID=431308 RepID=UPI00262E2AAA|nr:fasciclin domain-containing protein [uncultured Maribacter sp.]